MILALDPGLATCGWAIVTPLTGQVLALGVLLSEPDRQLDDSTDRARRIAVQAEAIRTCALAQGCTSIAAEAMSFGGSPKARFSMAISLGLSWGAIAGVATALALELREVPPKVWQHAVAGVDATSKTKVDYEVVFAKLARFVRGEARRDLARIAKRHRNHALDAAGVGVFTALRPSQATRIRR